MAFPDMLSVQYTQRRQAIVQVMPVATQAVRLFVHPQHSRLGPVTMFARCNLNTYADLKTAYLDLQL